MYCAQHPKVETALTCGRCATPICTECAVSGAVGMLCKKCAFGGGNPLFTIRPERWALTIAAGLISGTVAGFLLQAIGGFFMFLLCPLIGGFIGQVVLWAAGYKRGRKLEYLAGACVVFGALLSAFLDHYYLVVFRHPLSAVFFLVGIGIVTASAIARVRHW